MKGRERKRSQFFGERGIVIVFWCDSQVLLISRMMELVNIMVVDTKEEEKEEIEKEEKRKKRRVRRRRRKSRVTRRQ